MPQSFGAIYLHYIFSTKHRCGWLTPEVCERLYPFIGGLARDRKCSLLRIGSITDHVHLLVQSARDISPADYVGQIKSNSSGWVHDHFPELKTFAWHQGYAVFTVSQSVLETVTKYIDNQVEHHRTWTLQDEYRSFLLKHNMEIDERYAWD